MKSVEELKFSTCRQFPQICNLIYSFKNLEPEIVAYDNVCDVEKNMAEKRKLSFFVAYRPMTEEKSRLKRPYFEKYNDV